MGSVRSNELNFGSGKQGIKDLVLQITLLYVSPWYKFTTGAGPSIKENFSPSKKALIFRMA